MSTNRDLYASGPPGLDQAQSSDQAGPPTVVLPTDVATSILSVMKDLTWELRTLQAQVKDLSKAVYDLKNETRVSAQGTAAAVRDLAVSIESLKAGLCAQTAEHGDVRYARQKGSR